MKTIQFVLLLLCASFLHGQIDSRVEYYRHLKYNHISPFIEITGVHPIDKVTAKSTSHYVFKFDVSGRLSEVVNNHYHTEKRHPLASIGVYKVEIKYSEDRETRIFLDPNGKRISNDRGVYKEVYSYGKGWIRSALRFYDLKDEPMESNWGIAKYQWTQGEDFVVEHRYDLMNNTVNLSPYFEFGITGIQIDDDGLAAAHFNLNDQLEVVNNSFGVASYKDRFDSNGNHIEYSYFNEADSLTLNQWQFAVGKKSYDKLGNHILLEHFDTNGTLTRSRPIYSNAIIELSPSASTQDSMEIKKQSLGYLKALQKLDPILMNEVMNDSLNKVTIGYNREIQKEVARPTTREQMITFAEDWNKSNSKFPPVPNDQVTILGIYDRIASVQLVSDNWVEYLHLIKLNEKWKIINLIWQHKDINRYPK